MRRLLPLLAAAALGAGAAAALTGDDGRSAAARWTAPDRAFSVALPQGWAARASGPAGTVLQRGDGTGTVVVRARGALGAPLTRLAGPLAAELRRSLPGARAAGTRRFRAGGREAIMASVVRGSGVHAVAVVPAEGRSWSLDVVTRDGSTSAAAEAGALLQSFRPAQGAG